MLVATDFSGHRDNVGTMKQGLRPFALIQVAATEQNSLGTCKSEGPCYSIKGQCRGGKRRDTLGSVLAER